MSGDINSSSFSVDGPIIISSSSSSSLDMPLGNLPSYSGFVTNQQFSFSSNQQDFLFTDQEDVCMSKIDETAKLDTSSISELRSIMAFIYNDFGNNHAKSYNLNCFFYTGKGENKSCFQYLKSLPFFRLSLSKDNLDTIFISSDWNGDPKTFNEWDSLECSSSSIERNPAIIYKVKSTFAIVKVSKISVYKWGFEILNEDSSVQLIAIMSYALEPKFDPLLGKTGWEPPFNKEAIKTDSDFMKLVAEWRKQ